MALRLMSVNIEGALHLEKVCSLIDAEKPDVLCVQELLEAHVPRFEALLSGGVAYVPMSHIPGNDRRSFEGVPAVLGIGIFSRAPHGAKRTHYYHKHPYEAAIFDNTTSVSRRNTQSHALLVVNIVHEGKEYRVGTTHFTWTPDGQPDYYQRKDIQKLLSLLKQEEPLCFSGDFNASRGGEIFSLIASTYHDNIPSSYSTSLDLSSHRDRGTSGARLKTLMVDGLFTSPEYEVSDVRLTFGVSDHAAISASITKRA